jgi:hypothetical protein
MSLLNHSFPASLRKPVESSGFVQGLMARSHAPMSAVGPESRAVALSKSRFARLPEEPEDARLTGVTRSLNRRLLALNVPGSLRRDSVAVMAVAKIA